MVYISRKAVLGTLLGVLVAGSLVFAIGASGKSQDGGHGGNTLFRSTLAPSVPAPADPAFHGINPGGVPWVLTSSSVELKASGELDVRVEGLVIPGKGNPGPVKTISASLLCGADSETGAAATTGQVPLSSVGDARIDAMLALPPSCLAPIVVVNPNGNTAAYIAISGWAN